MFPLPYRHRNHSILIQEEAMALLDHLALIQNQAAAPQMTTGGWVFMASAWIGILLLVVFCFSKILRNKKK